MLEGIAANPIIVGAYTTSDGVCPMLAAHRAGGRTNLISFARAWDRFAFRDARKARARRATGRELLVLKTYLEASLLEDDTHNADLAAAQREHLELIRHREAQTALSTRPARRRPQSSGPPARPRPGDPDRSAELSERPGWAWTRPVRRYDDYTSVLAQLEREADAATPSPDPALASC
jgi:hypothetical protein